jgi:hypothetical protein
MKVIKGNIWDKHFQVKVIPTNGIVHNGKAVMGAGLAKQAAKLYPNLPHILGARLEKYGTRLYMVHLPISYWEVMRCGSLALFPTKHDWRDGSDLELIKNSCQQLMESTIENGWENILLPKVGTGLGKLSWEEVEPILDYYFDDRYTVIEL